MNAEDIKFEAKEHSNGFIKLSLIDERCVLLEVDRIGAGALGCFIEEEIVNDTENAYSFTHLISVPGVSEIYLASGSLDFYIERTDEYISAPSKTGKKYFRSDVLPSESKEFLTDPDSYIDIGQRDGKLVNLSCNKAWLVSFCNFLRVLGNGTLSEIRLSGSGENSGTLCKCNEGAVDLLIVRKEE